MQCGASGIADCRLFGCDEAGNPTDQSKNLRTFYLSYEVAIGLEDLLCPGSDLINYHRFIRLSQPWKEWFSKLRIETGFSIRKPIGIAVRCRLAFPRMGANMSNFRLEVVKDAWRKLEETQ